MSTTSLPTSSLDITSNSPSHASTRELYCRPANAVVRLMFVTSASLTIPLDVTYDPSNERQSAY
eukprot:4557115-Prorocentrum_lima.AAC.1